MDSTGSSMLSSDTRKLSNSWYSVTGAAGVVAGAVVAGVVTGAGTGAATGSCLLSDGASSLDNIAGALRRILPSLQRTHTHRPVGTLTPKGQWQRTSSLGASL